MESKENPVKWILKRNGQSQIFDKGKVIKLLSNLKKGLKEEFIDEQAIAEKVESGIKETTTSKELVSFIAETIAYNTILHPDYSLLAARVSVSLLHKETHSKLIDYATELHKFVDVTGRDCKLLADDVFEVFVEHHEELQEMIDYSRDFTYDFFGLKTLEKSYLLRKNGKIAERPQQLIMRVAVGIHKRDLAAVRETYQLMSQKFFTHATPTLFNSGTPYPQQSSCFLLSMKSDSIDGIYETLKRCALISKSAGGIGLSVSCIRAKDSYIRGTNGYSNGLVPMLRVFDVTARYVDQGGGKRKGSFAVYIEPWHADIFDFLSLKKNHGKEEMRARDLFYALWIPDLFMRRVESDEEWTLMCPAECPGLDEKWGEEFEKLYTGYEASGRGRKKIKARFLWNEIIQSQIETGTPYMLYKDACNSKSNQKNLGTIKCSNLCTEIVEYTSEDEVAVCNLASIGLQRFVNLETMKFDFQQLIAVTRVITRNLNRIIDGNYYPVPEARTSNLRHRPIGIGVQGLADTYAMLKLDYDSKEALDLNNSIFETIYYGACLESLELSKIYGPYETFKGSPASEGKLQFDLWNVTPTMYDWTTLKKSIVEHGMRNSLLLAPMPTASTSQILGANETFEAFTSNLYSRRVLSGEFICVNKYLVTDLIAEGLWTKSLRSKILACNGSIQNIPEIPSKLRKLYRTVWEIPQKSIIDLAVGRGPFIDQSQSLNIHLSAPDFNKMSAMHFYGWSKGLKTGMYYLRSRPAVDAIKFTVDQQVLAEMNKQPLSELLVKRENKENFEENGNGTSLKACPMRKKVLDKVTGMEVDDEDCLNCGS